MEKKKKKKKITKIMCRRARCKWAGGDKAALPTRSISQQVPSDEWAPPLRSVCIHRIALRCIPSNNNHNALVHRILLLPGHTLDTSWCNSMDAILQFVRRACMNTELAFIQDLAAVATRQAYIFKTWWQSGLIPAVPTCNFTPDGKYKRNFENQNSMLNK